MSEVLVIGATGKTGRAVTRALLARGVRVRAAVRPGSRGLPYAAGLGSRSTPAPAPHRSSGPDAHTPPGETGATRVPHQSSGPEVHTPPGETRATRVPHQSSGPDVHTPPGETGATRVVVVALDLTTGLGLDEAMTGVDGVYHLAPNVHPDEVAIATRVVESAGAAGVSRFAFHSVLHPDDASMPHHLRKAAAEEVIRARLSGAVVLRPAAYAQNLLDATVSGRIVVPYSIDARFTNVDLDDVAQVAAAVLTETGHEGATYELCGPETLSVREQARVASEVLGYAVEASQVSLEEWSDGPGATVSEQAREDLVAMFRSYDRGGLVGDGSTLERLLARPGTTWRQVLEREVAVRAPLRP